MNPIRIWALTHHRTGDNSQVLGVANRLGMPFEVKEVTYTPRAKLHNVVLGPWGWSIDPACKATALSPPWPDVVISAGRRLAPVSRWIKRQNRGRTFLCHMMWPGWPAKDFDMIAVPAHDQRRDSTQITVTLSAPHRLSRQTLTEGRERWISAFEALPRPWVGVLIGGEPKQASMPMEQMRELIARIEYIQEHTGGSLLATTSRRTGQEAGDLLEASLRGMPHYLHRWTPDGRDNPYAGILGAADALVVTGDSVSMCSEACYTGKPVFIFEPKAALPAKHEDFLHRLYAEGYARPVTAPIEYWDYAPLDATDQVAVALRHRLTARLRQGEHDYTI